MTAPAGSSGEKPLPLPALRTDLRYELMPAGDGPFPSLTLCDPVRGSYFRIEWPQSGLVLLWQYCADTAALRAKMRTTYGMHVDAEDIAHVVVFLAKNQLTLRDEKDGWQSYAAQQAKGRHGWLPFLLHNYLFFKIPLVHPDRMLRRVLPRLGFVFERPFWYGVAAIAAIGIYLTTRQWSAVAAAFEDAMQLQALLLFAAAALGLKAIHEFGHALTTTHFGCRVPSMGVAFMLGTPVLYTDVSDSWRLGDKWQRLKIVFAGVLAEMVVASIAILLWPALTDGFFKSFCFSVATTSIVLSLAVNLNPFMRFDGYFALSDYLNIPNLQPRAFELTTWRIWEALFGLGAAPPEHFPQGTRRFLLAYSILTWIYRFFLYLGIAAFVYVVSGKTLGIILGLFEIVIFIFLPVYREAFAWWQLRDQIKTGKRTLKTACSLAALIVVVCLPWITTVESPVLLAAATEQEVHAPIPAMIRAVHVKNGEHVPQGGVLFTAHSSQLAHDMRKAKLQVARYEVQLARLLASKDELENSIIIRSKLSQAVDAIQAIKRQMEQLVIRAPFAGTVADLDVAIRPGDFVNQDGVLARIIDSSGAILTGLVSDADVQRLKAGAATVFIADDPTAKRRHGVLRTIAPAGQRRLAEPALADVHGGIVPAGDRNGSLETRHGWLEVTLDLDPQPSPPIRIERGVARIAAEPISPLMLAWNHIARLVAREQGF